MADTITIEFIEDRETKNAIRFQEELGDRDRGVIGTLYVLKSELEKLGNPSKLVVTITAVG